MLFAMALQAAVSSIDVDARTARLTALYDEICLKTFPDDKAVTAIMTARNARELTPAEVKVTMRDDPARAWQLADDKATVWIEFPPFHACSVRWSTPQIGNLAPYRAIADQYEKSVGGFRPISGYDADQGEIHIHAVGEGRPLPDKGAESLYVFDQHVTDPQKRAAGATGIVFRFVHQIAPPAPAAAK